MKIQQSKYLNIPEEKRNGQYDVFIGEHKLSSVQYKNGLLNGKVVKYDNNDNIFSIRTYKNNLLNGISKKFENGELFLEEIWENGNIVIRNEYIGKEKKTTKYDKKGNTIK